MASLVISILTVSLTCFRSVSSYPTDPADVFPRFVPEPYEGLELEPRQGFNCNSTNPQSSYRGECWAQLDLTNWLKAWHAPNICGASGGENSSDGVNCCDEGEEWSTCFLRLGKGDSGYDCTAITSNTNDCAYSNALSPDLVPEIRAQVRLTIEPIVTAVSPAPSLSVSINDILFSLIAGLPFLGAPLFAAEITASAAAHALVTGIRQAPGLAKALWPTGSVE
ncbi:MAG: hypothetical protein Q9222_007588, partial [Ikaeria aurantiellina]